MYDLPKKIAKQIRLCEPITTDGVTMYPIKVAEFDEFSVARPAVEIMQRELPVKYLSMPILSAFYQMDYEAIANHEPRPGLFYCAMLFLALSFRLGVGHEPQERVKWFLPVTDENEPSRLLKVRFVINGEQIVDLTPAQFQRLRPILAEQNGITYHSEDENPELVRAEIDAKSRNAPKLDYNVDELVATISCLSRVDATEIYETWTIARLLNEQSVWSRVLGYVVCGIGEAQGTKWKGGNPFPSPFFDKLKTDGGGLMEMGSFADGNAMTAIQNPADEGVIQNLPTKLKE